MLAGSFVGYLVALILIGALTYRLNKSIEDFVIAGRKLGAWVTAISAQASDMSGWLLLGIPGIAYTQGFGGFWTIIGSVVGVFFNWTVLAKRLRRYTEKLKAITLPDFYEARFRDEDKKHLRVLSAVILIVFLMFYVSAQFVASGKALGATFGFSYAQSVLIGAAVIVFYTMMGGFFAVAYTDLFQGLLMVGMLVILPVVALFSIGGFGGMLKSMHSVDPGFLSFQSGKLGFAAFTLVVGHLAIGLGYPGQPHIVTRFMAIKDPKKIRQSTLISMIWVLLAGYGALFIGLTGLGVRPGLQDPETITMTMAMMLMPDWLAGLMIAAAMAAIMSTADSQLLVATSAIAEDFYRKMFKKDASQKILLRISRVATLIIALIALLFALSQDPQAEGGIVFSFVLYAWGGLAASFGPLLILSLYWKRITKAGAVAGMLVGTGVVIVWYNVACLKAIVYELVPAFVLSLLSIVIVSLLTKPPEGIAAELNEIRPPSRGFNL
ncbi:MAG: sodium/proline symporter [Candidatus Coatesbacteria bacterium]|nr:sodium/proline symporter [Candidatus Coatesbacteria bacterium]